MEVLVSGNVTLDAERIVRSPVAGSISVVIPAFNASRFLRETLESVLAQTLRISHNGLRALQFQDEVYRRHILPNVHETEKKSAYTRFRSEHEAAAALVLRRRDDPDYLGMMTRSIARDPLHAPHRYKIWLHMVYTTLLCRFAAT